MKKNVLYLLLIALFLSVVPGSRITAEDYSNKEYWESYCDLAGSHVSEDTCKEYYRQKLLDSNARIQELEKAKKNISGNIEEALANARQWAQEAAAYNDDIATLSVQIKDLVTQIDALTVQIDTNKTLVEELNQRVLNRMKNAQGTMHFNPYLDFILGSEDFVELSRRSYGIQAITEKDSGDRNELLAIINQLQEDEKKLQDSKSELDVAKKDLETKQAEYYAAEEYYRAVANEWETQLETIQNELDQERKTYSGIAQAVDLSGVPSSAGLLSPAPGARINAGTWYYPASFGGGVHLGVDYGLSKGSNLYAPASGVVIVSSDGCGDGYLGNSCAGNGGGVAYGGNQVIMMVAAGGSIYAVSFFHLLKGSPVSTGVISQGDYIGRVGSSGNSTGPHCHIELFYLGPGEMSDLESDYLYRSYSTSFNCGWGTTALRRLCENGVGAPCRLRPENYFGS